MEQKTITLSLVGYEIRGVSDLTPWGGGNACIEMAPFMTETPEKRDIYEKINDNGFGVESINGAICHIFEVYADEWGNKMKKFLKTTTVGKVSRQTREFEESIQ